MISNEEWCWDSVEPQQLSSYPIAYKSNEVALLVQRNNVIYIRLHSKCLKYSYE